jgi:metal-sulfur cluster biosynthetic enzyme
VTRPARGAGPGREVYLGSDRKTRPGADSLTALARQVNAAWNALTYVHDPDLGLDIVSLGLVYDVRAEDGVIVVEMTRADPGRPAAADLPQMAQTAVIDALGDAAAVDLRVVWDPPWRPEMIDGRALRAPRPQ